MAEVLSQSQIDELLRNINTGEVKIEDTYQVKIKEYDFRSPKRFTREQLKIIDSIYQNYARRLSSYLSGVLRVYCEATVLQIEEQRYYEFNNALADSVLMGNLNIRYPVDEEIEDQLLLMEVSKSISFSIIDRLLGGSGSSFEVTRDYTEIEISILQTLFKAIVPLMKEPWSNYFTIEPSLTKIETNSRLVQALDADETVLIIVMNVKVNDMEGKINVCMSGASLNVLLAHLNARDGRKGKKGEQIVDEMGKENILTSVKKGTLEVTAVLGTATVNLNDILNLRIGDVVELNQNVDSPITLFVGTTPWFVGALGSKKNKKAIRIADYYEKRGRL